MPGSLQITALIHFQNYSISWICKTASSCTSRFAKDYAALYEIIAGINDHPWLCSVIMTDRVLILTHWFIHQQKHSFC
jgi:hypothetical protein